jgi:hypothetical protein
VFQDFPNRRWSPPTCPGKQQTKMVAAHLPRITPSPVFQDLVNSSPVAPPLALTFPDKTNTEPKTRTHALQLKHTKTQQQSSGRTQQKHDRKTNNNDKHKQRSPLTFPDLPRLAPIPCLPGFPELVAGCRQLKTK